jgi:hypothetical protein
MEMYNNGGGGTSTGSESGGGVAQLGGAVISSLAGYFGGAEQGRKNRDLMNDLAQLSLAQQKQLEERLQDAKTETERQGLAYQFLALQKNNEAVNKIQGKRYTSYIVLGVGVTILALVFLKLSKK